MSIWPINPKNSSISTFYDWVAFVFWQGSRCVDKIP